MSVGTLFAGHPYNVIMLTICWLQCYQGNNILVTLLSREQYVGYNVSKGTIYVDYNVIMGTKCWLQCYQGNNVLVTMLSREQYIGYNVIKGTICWLQCYQGNNIC